MSEKWGLEPYIPIYARSPNKLLRYEDRPFTCNAGIKGIERVAIFQDKKGNVQEMTAYIKWLEEIHKGK